MLGTKLFCTGHFQLLDAVSEMLHLLITILLFSVEVKLNFLLDEFSFVLRNVYVSQIAHVCKMSVKDHLIWKVSAVN